MNTFTLPPRADVAAMFAGARPATGEPPSAEPDDPVRGAVPRIARSACTQRRGWPYRDRRAGAMEVELRGLLTMTCHDLKTPLAVVAANLDLLREDRGSQADDDRQRNLDAMDRAVRRMNRLAESLITHARADQAALALRPVPLDDLVAEVIAEHLTTGGGARVTVHGPLPHVPADPELLWHVIDNLIGNALKYTRPGSAAQVDVSAWVLPDGAVRVEVADDGIGIPEVDRPKVFEAFHRSSGSGGHQGTGLGLTICRRIVERHGGRIGVAEQPAGGSCFWFVLPA
jgi:signal transduction histidine kinase